MQQGRRLRSSRRAFLVLLTLCLLATLSLPAVAQSEGGTGRFVGAEEAHELEDNPPTAPPCLKVVEATMSLQGVGTYYGLTDAGERAVYRAQTEQGQQLHEGGPLELVIDSDEHFIAPEGTYAQRLSRSEGCDQRTYGEDGKIPATFTLRGANHVHDQDDPCTGDGHWWRVHSTIVAEWTWDSGCTVEGNEPGFLGAGTAPPDTAHRIEGNFDPCFSWDWPCEDNIRVSFTQTLPRFAETAGTPHPSGAARDRSRDDGAERPSRFIGASGVDHSGTGRWVLTGFAASLVLVVLSSRWQRRAYRWGRPGQPSE